MGNKLGRSTESKFTKSTGLYPTCEWDDKAVKKLINKKKIAPRFPGREDAGADMEECPICFLWYPGGLNRSKCCRQPICTECFLQFKKPTSQKAVQCPFCNAYNYSVKYYGALSKEEREAIEQEEQKVIAAQIRIKKEEMERQEEREKELHAERKKRAEEGPPPPARAPPPQPAAERLPAADSARRQRTSQYGQPRGGQQSDQMAMSSDPRYNQSHLAASQQYPSDDAYLDRDDNFQVDVEELMVMEAIRLSLLESHSRGPRLDGSSGEQDGLHEDSGQGEVDDDDDGDESSEDGAYLEGVEGSEDEHWARAGWGETGPAAHGGNAQVMEAASSRQRSCFQDELARIEAAMAMEDESGGGVADLISYNQSWFRVLMMSRAEDESARISSSPSIHAASSPAALEPASTLSPVVTARPYSSQRNSLSHENGEAEKLLSPLQNMRDRAVTPTRHLKSENLQVSGSTGKTCTKLTKDQTLDPTQLSFGENRTNDAAANPPVSPLIFGIASPSAAVEALGSGGLSDPSSLPVGTADTYQLHFSPAGTESVERETVASHDIKSVEPDNGSNAPISSEDQRIASGKECSKEAHDAVPTEQKAGACANNISDVPAPNGAEETSASQGDRQRRVSEKRMAGDSPRDGGRELKSEEIDKRAGQNASNTDSHGQPAFAAEYSDRMLNHGQIVLVANSRDMVSNFHQKLSTTNDGVSVGTEVHRSLQIGEQNFRIYDFIEEGSRWPGDLNQVRAIVLVFKSGDVGKANQQVDAILRMEAVSHVPIVLIASQEDEAAVGGDGDEATAGRGGYEELRASLNLGDLLVGEGASRQAQEEGKRAVQLFTVRSRTSGRSGWQDAVDWLHARLRVS